MNTFLFMIKTIFCMKTPTTISRKIEIILISISFISCQKNEIAPNNYSGESEEFTEQSVLFKTQGPSFRGVYIDGFSTKIGIQSSEDSILNWCLKNNLNEISLYGINAIITSNKTVLLNSFIGKAKAAPYNINVSFVAASATTVNNEYSNYYLTHTNKFDAITSEYEYWNSGNSFQTFQIQLNAMSSINQATSGAIKRQLYISKFVDASGIISQDTILAREVVQESDRIFLVNYSTNAYNLSSTTLSKMKTVANAAKKLNKIMDIVILFNLNRSSVDPNIFNYVSVNGSNHAFSDAYTKFKTDYNAVSFSNKTSLNIVGFQLYNYSEASLARP